MILNYYWAMPNKNTFKIKPIYEFLKENCDPYNQLIIDPFANRKHQFATITNDLNPDSNTDYNLDAVSFLNMFDDYSVDVILFDPPYSLRQLKECYSDIGISLTQKDTQLFWHELKEIISKKIKPGGKVISFGWNSVGIGKQRNFTKKEIILISHGGNHNDTIVTLERKNQNLLKWVIQ